MPSVTPLAGRLRALRLTGRPRHEAMTQGALAKALHVSVPLISSWENGTVPPPERLDEYARLFAGTGEKPRLKAPGDLDEAESLRYTELRAELLALRDDTTRPVELADVVNPLQFPVGEAITIVCSELPGDMRAAIGHEEASDPNYIDSYKYADLDALFELLPSIRMFNATNPIAVGVARELSIDDLTAHLIVLGGVDVNQVTAAVLVDLQHVPVSQLERATEADTGAFAVRSPNGERRELKPILTNEHGKITLKEDIAHFLRAPNPYNRFRTLTIFNGLHSRGSYGVVRALTDPKIRDRNAEYIAHRFSGDDTYNIVCRVKIVADEVVVPDWTADDMRLHEWPEEGT